MNTTKRSEVNSSKVAASDLPKSGFDLSYKNYRDFILGRLHVAGYQHIMPADKMSGSTNTKFTFNRLVVPEISDVDVSQHTFYVPYRSIDSTFIKGMVPTELNSMSSSWRTPLFKLSDTIINYCDEILYSVDDSFDLLSLLFNNNQDPSDTDYRTVVLSFVNSLSINSFPNSDLTYVSDWWQDYIDRLKVMVQTLPTQAQMIDDGTLTQTFAFICLDAFFTPLFGEGSLLDSLGYNILSRADLLYISKNVGLGESAPSVSVLIDNTPQCEYALRAYYAIWYTHYRDPYLEKRSSDLPDWRDFGSTPCLDDVSAIVWFLPERIRSWSKDMFVGSMPDDISRHVFAPIFSKTLDGTVDSLSDGFNYLNAELGSGFQNGVNSAVYSLTYLDPASGEENVVRCPVPKAVNDSLSTLSASMISDNNYALDLRDLRKSQMIERYLKRNFYFGDEYEDRMLAHYGSKVSDNSIRRPHLLCSSLSSVNPTQEVASIGTELTPAGTRTATAAGHSSSDSYQFFAEEFGIVITILSVMPKAQYHGICPQNLLAQMTDFPLPEFAQNNDEFGRVMEVATNGLKKSSIYDKGMFGHYPYAHAYRSRVDEVHGSFLSDRSDYTFRRFFGLTSDDQSPRLNFQFIHCRPNLGMFEDTVRLDGQGYCTCDNTFYVERVLPAPVEQI